MSVELTETRMAPAMLTRREVDALIRTRGTHRVIEMGASGQIDPRLAAEALTDYQKRHHRLSRLAIALVDAVLGGP